MLGNVGTCPKPLSTSRQGSCYCPDRRREGHRYDILTARFLCLQTRDTTIEQCVDYIVEMSLFDGGAGSRSR